MTARILHGDALEQLQTLPAESVHSIVTDPPYQLVATKEPDREHVAWLRYVYVNEKPTRIVLCDSDEAGAFKVYR